MSAVSNADLTRRRDEATEELFSCFRAISLHLDATRNRVRLKPMISRSLGFGRFSLASFWSIEGGLDVITYYVMDTACRFVIAVAGTKHEALAMARRVVADFGARIPAEIRLHVAAANAARETEKQRWEQHRADRLAALPPKVKSIGRRRKQIFEESDGKCHYCGAVLTLDGKWHIEHKMPRALGGGNEPGNLVASCVPCNMKKRDLTDVEFKARINKTEAA